MTIVMAIVIMAVFVSILVSINKDGRAPAWMSRVRSSGGHRQLPPSLKTALRITWPVGKAGWVAEIRILIGIAVLFLILGQVFRLVFL